MKVVMASAGNTQQALISKIFARCPWFVFYDTDTGAIEFYPNTFKDLSGEVGKEIMDLILSRNVSLAISGRFGAKMKAWMDSRKIQMAVYHDQRTVEEILDLLKRNATDS